MGYVLLLVLIVAVPYVAMKLHQRAKTYENYMTQELYTLRTELQRDIDRASQNATMYEQFGDAEKSREWNATAKKLMQDRDNVEAAIKRREAHH